jgi:hypothetical protein
MLSRAAALIVLAILAGYGVIKALPMLSGPSLSIESPAPYVSLPDGYLRIAGTAEHTESLTVNGGQVLIDQEGRFDRLILLPPGGAILTFTARDRFGRSTTEERTVFIP